MLFQAVMKFLSRLVEFKILVNWGMVHCDSNSYPDKTVRHETISRLCSPSFITKFTTNFANIFVLNLMKQISICNLVSLTNHLSITMTKGEQALANCAIFKVESAQLYYINGQLRCRIICPKIEETIIAS